MCEFSWTDIVCGLKDGKDPIQGTHEEVLDALKALFSSAEKAEEAYGNDPSSFCDKIEREMGYK